MGTDEYRHTEDRSRDGLEKKVMAGLFLLMVCLFSATGMLMPDRAYSPMENRFLAQMPTLRLQGILSAEYMRAMEEYVTDQFPGRDFWVSLKSFCQKLSGQKENNGVYYSSDGYLIGKPQEAAEDVLGRNLSAVLALQSVGFDVSLLVCPMAVEILADKLPSFAYTPEQANLMTRLRKDAQDAFVDVEAGLRQAAADGRQVFFRTDHHWTMAGAYAAYQAYMDWLGEEARPLASFTENLASDAFYGTLWSKNSHPGISPDSIYYYEPDRSGEAPAPVYEVGFFDGSNTAWSDSLYQREYLEQKDKYAFFLGQNKPLVTVKRYTQATETTMADASAISAGTETPAETHAETPVATSAEMPATAPAEMRKLLLFKDSYAHCFAPFLFIHFDEIHMIDLRYWKQDPIAYMEEQGITQVLFLYSADSFSSDRSISMLGAYIAAHAQ